MRLCLSVLIASISLSAAPVAAMMPPEVYEEARATAADVIVFEVLSVEPPKENMGNCTVEGKVLAVERGTSYAAGDSVSISVSCLSEFTAEVPVGGTIWQDTESLSQSSHGRAFLNGGSVALDQYEQLDAGEVPRTKDKQP